MGMSCVFEVKLNLFDNILLKAQSTVTVNGLIYTHTHTYKFHFGEGWVGGGVTWSYLGEEVQKTWWTVLIWIFLFVRTLRLKVCCFGGLYRYLLGVIKSKCFNWWLTVTENLTYCFELYFFLDGHCWTFSVSLLGVILLFYFIYRIFWWKALFEKNGQGNDVPSPFMTFESTGFPSTILKEVYLLEGSPFTPLLHGTSMLRSLSFQVKKCNHVFPILVIAGGPISNSSLLFICTFFSGAMFAPGRS